MAKNKQLVFCLSKGEVTAIHFDQSGLCSALEMELDNTHEDDLLEIEFKVTAKFMTEKEIKNLPEFEGF